MSIRLIAGLGNPGPRYEDTRHNAGFWMVDRLAKEMGVHFRSDTRFFGEITRMTGSEKEDGWLLKPMVLMNRSGQSVAALAHFYKIAISEILIIHDDLDLATGIARLKQGGGHGGHNGLRDLMAHLGVDFHRLRLGIGHPGNAHDVVEYVLNRPSQVDEQLIQNAIDQALKVLPWIRAGEFQKAMNHLHSFRPSLPAQPA